MSFDIILNNSINKFEKKINDLKKEIMGLSYTTNYKKEIMSLEPGYISLPYESDFLNKNDFNRYYEIEGEIEVLTFLKEQVFELALEGGFSDMYDNFVNEDKELAGITNHIKLGSIKSLAYLNELFL